MKNKSLMIINSLLIVLIVTLSCGGGGDSGDIVDTEGTITAPLLLTLNVAHNGHLGASTYEAAYYYVNVTPGSSYTVKLTNKSVPVDLRVYTDATYAYGTCVYDSSQTISDVQTTVTATGSKLAMIIDSTVHNGLSFTILVQ